MHRGARAEKPIEQQDNNICGDKGEECGEKHFKTV